MHHDIPAIFQIIFTVATAFGVLMQAFVLLLMFFALKGALTRMNEVSRRAEEHVLPALETTKDLLKEISPKVKVATQNLLEVSQTAKDVSNTVKAESTQMAVALNDILERTAVQVDRIDEMVTGTLSTVAHATGVLQKAVSGPARQVGALLSGLRAGLDVLRKKDNGVHAAADGDHFV